MSVASLQWVYGPDLANSSLSYSDLHNTDHYRADEAQFVPVLVLDATVWGDYCGSTIERANYGYVGRIYEGARELRELSGGYGSSGYVLTLDADTARWVRTLRESWLYSEKRNRDHGSDGMTILQHMVEAYEAVSEGEYVDQMWVHGPDATVREQIATELIALENYPLFDDEEHSMLEMELIEQAWDFTASDLVSAIVSEVEEANEDTNVEECLDEQMEQFHDWFYGAFYSTGNHCPAVEDAGGSVAWYGMDDEAAHGVAATFLATGTFPWQVLEARFEESKVAGLWPAAELRRWEMGDGIVTRSENLSVSVSA